MAQQLPIFEDQLCGPHKWADRALVWVEYLVRVEAYDRALPGSWAHSVEGDMGGGRGQVWLVGPERLRDSVLNAQHHHRRALVALRAMLGRLPELGEEAAVMNVILEKLPTHSSREAALGDRSPATELVGPDILAAAPSDAPN